MDTHSIDESVVSTPGEFDAEGMSEALERESRRYNRRLEEEEEARRK